MWEREIGRKLLMEAPEEEVVINMEGSNSIKHHQDHTQILKGKRTKRQRPQSPLPFLIAPVHPAASPSSSPASSMEESPAAAATEEEEDLAHCLILLAQGRSRAESFPTRHHPTDQEKDTAPCKVSSRRYVAEATTPYKVGLYVYECKTCSRTFPSFQALGGHRASHKKPKLAAAAAEEKKNQLAFSEDEEGQQQQFKSINSPPPLSLQLNAASTMPRPTNHNKSNKLHECAICGAEFTSGQALGGHMRRHRGPVVGASPGPANVTLSLSPMAAMESPPREEKKPQHSTMSTFGGGGGGDFLSLDLNLPAVAEDGHHNQDSTFALTLKQEQEQLEEPQQQQQQQPQSKQPRIVFSAPPLVDCNY